MEIQFRTLKGWGRFLATNLQASIGTFRQQIHFRNILVLMFNPTMSLGTLLHDVGESAVDINKHNLDVSKISA